MIIVLTGPTGVGKSDTSWALIQLAQPMVFLDCDWFAARVPFSWKFENDVESVYQALSVMLDYHTRRGAGRFVIPVTLEMAVSYAKYRQYFDRFSLPLFQFRLSCRPDQLRERVLKRDRNDVQRTEELDVIDSQVKSCEALPGAFIPIDVSALDEQAVARKILDTVIGNDQRAQLVLATDAPQAVRR